MMKEYVSGAGREIRHLRGSEITEEGMGFDALLGNDRLKENLRHSVGRGRISHFYLISGPEGSGKRTLARLLAAAIVCTGAQKPCGICAACRKVLSGSHPDFITVDDPEKKTVPVDLIRKARADMYIQPNEADRKIYLFPRGQDMGVPGQNALLKILEEPPAYGVFILLTDRAEALLPTVRSRGTALAMQNLPERLMRARLTELFPQAGPEEISGAIARSGGWLGQAQALLSQGKQVSPQTEKFTSAFAARDKLLLLQALVPMERWKRDQVLPVLEQWLQILQSALVSRSGVQAVYPAARVLSTARSSQELMDAVHHLQKAIEYTQGNVSVAAVCGYLEWVLQ